MTEESGLDHETPIPMPESPRSDSSAPSNDSETDLEIQEYEELPEMDFGPTFLFTCHAFLRNYRYPLG